VTPNELLEHVVSHHPYLLVSFRSRAERLIKEMQSAKPGWDRDFDRVYEAYNPSDARRINALYNLQQYAPSVVVNALNNVFERTRALEPRGPADKRRYDAQCEAINFVRVIVLAYQQQAIDTARDEAGSNVINVDFGDGGRKRRPPNAGRC